MRTQHTTLNFSSVTDVNKNKLHVKCRKPCIFYKFFLKQPQATQIGDKYFSNIVVLRFNFKVTNIRLAAHLKFMGQSRNAT